MAAEMKCKDAKRCGGCDGFGRTYEEQLERKQRYVNRLLDEFCPVEKIAGMYYPYFYRNKVHRVFGLNHQGKPAYGMYAEGTHDIIPVGQCLLEDRQCQQIIQSVWELLPSFRIRTYDEDSQYGFLRHVILRKGFATGEIMVVLVTSDITWPGSKNFVKALLTRHPEITTIVQNVNSKRTTFLLGQRNKTLYGPGQIRDKLLGLEFAISPGSFYQVNQKQTEVLYRLAIQAAELTGRERVLDAYCGIGTIGMTAAAAGAGEVIGVELNKDAVGDAIRNARLNHLSNVRFVCQDAGAWMQQAAARGEKADVVFLDPPRSGSTPEFIAALAKMEPEKVVYVSCNPETLARDLRLFRRKGYQARRAWPVDQFPGTGHVETVCLLSNRKADSHIKLSLDMDEYYDIMEKEQAEKK